ncbi:MAG TPA: fumarylacetoacetate hydrolase family protein [Acidimicrobiia bacterium]|nr:fumarylacetoacetate hydrolase family protein [Acidimicrobiia bacterium]
MKLGRIGSPGEERPVVMDNGIAYDLSPVTDDIDSTFFASDGIERAATALAGGVLHRVDTDGVRVGAPVARPGAVVCIGMNYAAHAAETGAAPPEQPVVFFKTPNTVTGPNDDVVIPPGSEKTDWEVELAIVIGSQASYLDSPAVAMQHIAGFTVANDVSERAWQIEHSGGQWSKGKCAPGFNPLGPWLVTPDEVNHGQLRLRSWVNGEIRQDSTTADMIFDVPYLVWHLSHYMALEPGDLILTGTPQGVALSGRFPYLRHGDVVEVEIEGLGRQKQTFVDHARRRLD